jgi:integrase
MMLHERKDPIEVRRARITQARQDRESRLTFASCAKAYIAAHRSGWRSLKHADQWTATLTTYAFPIIGELAVDAVNTGALLKVLEPIWTTRTETAARVRGRIEAILDWAKARGLRDGDNPARWRGHLDHLLPPRSRVRAVVHHRALPYQDMPAFIAELQAQGGVAARGFELQILTAARTGEVIGARWEEFDADRRVWTIPATRMKAHREHRAALSSAALKVLTKLRPMSDSDFILPGLRPMRPLSNMAFLAVLKRMGRTDLTAHGFRSTFRDWAAEQTAYPSEVAEMALAHSISDKVEAAYRRGDLFAKRLALMEDWANFCQGRSSAVQQAQL